MTNTTRRTLEQLLHDMDEHLNNQIATAKAELEYLKDQIRALLNDPSERDYTPK